MVPFLAIDCEGELLDLFLSYFRHHIEYVFILAGTGWSKDALLSFLFIIFGMA